MMGASQVIQGDSIARSSNDGFGNVVETDDNDNGPDRRWSANESDSADIWRDIKQPKISLQHGPKATAKSINSKV